MAKLRTEITIFAFEEIFESMKRFLFILFIGMSMLCSAQTISGEVKDDMDETIPFATVALKQQSDSTLVQAVMTDTAGVFKLTAKPGKYYLLIQSFGLDDYISEVIELGEKDVVLGSISMKQDLVELEEVVIQAKKPLLQKTARGLVVNMESSPIMASGSTRDALTKIPGVVVNQDGSVSLKGKNNVVIYMDGKRTYMSLQQLINYLEGLPASDIEKIEVFDTPPAKFDAEGDAGIINIVLKKGVALGFNGMVGANLGYGQFRKVTPWGNFNYRRPKFNVYGNGWYFDRPTIQHFDSRTRFDAQELEYDSDALHTPSGGGGRAGFDWFINKKHTVGFLVLGYNGIWAGTSDGVNRIGTEEVFVDNERRFPWWGHGYNFNWVKDIKEGEKLSFDADMIKQGSSQRQIVESQYFDADTSQGTQFIVTSGTRNSTILASKMDYERKINKVWGLETGWKLSQVTSDYIQDGSVGTNYNALLPDPNNSSQFKYRENIYAGYAVLAGAIDTTWTFDAGFRFEQTSVIGESLIIDDAFDIDYLTIFPNFGINYHLSYKSDLSLAYSKRIRRPEYWQLSSYIVKVGEYNYEIGNPRLRPQNTNIYALTYSWDKAFFATLSFNHTTNNMTYLTDFDETTGITNNYYANLEDIYNYSLNFVVPIPIKKWWNANINLTGFYNQQSSDFKEFGIDNSLLSYTLNIQNYFELPKKYKLEIRGFYNGKNYWMTQLKDPMYQMSIGLAKEFKKVNVSLTYQDPFNWLESRGIIDQTGLDSDFYWKDESRLLKFSFSYKFGDNKVKAARRRESASEDLQNR